MLNLELLKKLSETPGLSGFEGPIRALIREELKGFLVDFSTDRSGSLICSQQGSALKPRIMLSAHMDEIGFLVKNITKQGFIKFITVGGWWNHILPGSKVKILTKKGSVSGVIGSKPPHFLKEEERQKLLELKDMFIDCGASSKDYVTQELEIKPGDPIVPDGNFELIGDKSRALGKAWDDRIGCALLVEIMRYFAKNPHPNLLLGAATVQEEVGIRGAQTAAAVVNPDLCFVLEGSPADDTPGFDPDETQTALGKGPQIRVYDPTMIPNQKLKDFVYQTACEKNIQHQLTVRESGGTDGSKIHLYKEGVPSIVIGIPTRYAHSSASIISLSDFDNALKLLSSCIEKLDEKVAESFITD